MSSLYRSPVCSTGFDPRSGQAGPSGFTPSRVVNKLLNTTVYFSAAWATRSVGTWSFTDYLVIIAAPGILYLQANTLVTADPDKVEDWRAHYFQIHRWFFAANFLLSPLGLLATHVVSEQPFPNSATFGFCLVGVLSMLGAISSNLRVHAVVAVLSTANLTLGFGSYVSQIGAQ